MDTLSIIVPVMVTALYIYCVIYSRQLWSISRSDKGLSRTEAHGWIWLTASLFTVIALAAEATVVVAFDVQINDTSAFFWISALLVGSANFGIAILFTYWLVTRTKKSNIKQPAR